MGEVSPGNKVANNCSTASLSFDPSPCFIILHLPFAATVHLFSVCMQIAVDKTWTCLNPSANMIIWINYCNESFCLVTKIYKHIISHLALLVSSRFLTQPLFNRGDTIYFDLLVTLYQHLKDSKAIVMHPLFHMFSSLQVCFFSRKKHYRSCRLLSSLLSLQCCWIVPLT